MNINNKAELENTIPAGFVSLNDECDKTNTAKTAKPYDHVMYNHRWTTEMDAEFDQKEMLLVELMEPLWKGPGSYPGKPYNRWQFPKYFSDHRPIHFKMNIPNEDDD